MIAVAFDQAASSGLMRDDVAVDSGLPVSARDVSGEAVLGAAAACRRSSLNLAIAA